MLPLLTRPTTSMWGERSVLSVPSSPSRAAREEAMPSPKRSGLGSGRLIGGQASTTSLGSPGAGTSQFQINHENTLRKNRNHFQGQIEQYSIDYHSSHNKALAELPVLQEQHALEIEEYQNAIEETVTRHLGRIAQLRQDYSLLIKEASRRHMELQQRRFAGARVDIPQVAQQPIAGLPALSAQPQIVAPSAVPNGSLAASRSGNVSTSSEQAGSHAMGQVNPNAYLRTLNNDAAAAMSQYNTRPLPATPGGIAALSISTPASPLTARLATPSEATARNSDFARLEAMHEKYMGRTKSQHEQGIAARINEVSNWQQTFAACMAALAQHQSSALAHLSSCVEEAEAWHAQQRGALSAAHDEVMTEAERLSRQLEAAQTAAAAKLNGLLASFLERVLPSGEVGLAEAQASYTRSAANLRNEHVAALEAAEAALRALIPRHAAMRQHMSASYSSGLASHEAALAAAGGHYDSRGIPELRRQYQDAESRHRDTLAAIRAEHLKGLAGSRDGWMGEAAALLEEYRARMQELKQQYMLAYDVNLTEV